MPIICADVVEVPRGPSMVFHIIIKCENSTDKTYTQEYSINCLAKVKFRFRDEFYRPTNEKAVDIAIKKENIDNIDDMNVKMYITCKSLNYYKQFVCSETWAEYVVYTGELPSKFEIGITVKKIRSIESRMTKLYEDTDFTDFVLSATDGRVPLHKACLAAHGDVFRTMLTTKWKETEEGCIELKNVTVKTLQHLKAYMYLGTVPDDEIDDLCPLLLLASQYMIQDLKDQCVTNLARTVKLDKLQCLIDFAVDNKMTDLIVAILQLTPNNVVNEAHEMEKN